MTAPPDTSYDRVAYRAGPFVRTHPDRLATLGLLFGLKAAPPERCRVLELGCAAGGNLIPMAAALPDSTFVGVDMARTAIAEGRAMAARLGLNNVALHCTDLRALGPSFGQYDYIIAHGLYSWVPADAQDRLLAICRQNLAPHGVAYVSHNVYPGWYARRIVRDMALYHVAKITDPDARVTQAEAFLAFVREAQGSANTAYAALLEQELAIIRDNPRWYVFHDHLEENNSAEYFHEFAARLAAKDLRYLADADFHMMFPTGLQDSTRATLERITPDLLQMEQHLDFLRNRVFRRTLCCHEAAPVQRDLQGRQLASFHIAASVVSTADAPDVRSTTPETFRSQHGATYAVTAPIAKAALTHLAAVWPLAVPFETLRLRAREILGPAPGATPEDDDAATLGSALLKAFASNLLDVTPRPSCFVAVAGVRPTASTVARLQAETGLHVANLRHEAVTLAPLTRAVLCLLDGSRDRDALLDALSAQVAAGALTVETTDAGDMATPRERLTAALEQALAALARAALLSA